jgi:carbon storage regulator
VVIPAATVAAGFFNCYTHFEVDSIQPCTPMFGQLVVGRTPAGVVALSSCRLFSPPFLMSKHSGKVSFELLVFFSLFRFFLHKEGIFMLILSRQRDEQIIIDDNIVVTIVDIRGDKVRLGIDAPTEIPVHRREVYEAIQRENLRASRLGLKDPKPPETP